MLEEDHLFHRYLAIHDELRKTFEEVTLKAGSNKVQNCLEKIRRHPWQNLINYIDSTLPIIENVFDSLSSEEQYDLLAQYFQELDSHFNHENGNDFITELGASNQFYFRTFKYWKKEKSNDPAGSTEDGFRNFGLCKFSHGSLFIDVAELQKQKKIEIDPPLSSQKELNVGLFPLSQNHEIKFKLTHEANRFTKTYGFLADHLSNPSLEEELIEIVNTIAEKNIQIACLPELVICDKCLEILIKEIRSRKFRFLILIAGSFHRKDKSDKFKNTMPVLLFMGEEVSELNYSKYNPFKLALRKIKPEDSEEIFLQTVEKSFTNLETCTIEIKEFRERYNLREDIALDPAILIIKTHEVGNLGFVICKDLLPEPNRKIPLYTKFLDHLFVISLNNSKDAGFEEKAIILRNRGIATYYVNSRNFDPKNLSRSFICLPNPASLQRIKASDAFIVHSLPINPENKRRR